MVHIAPTATDFDVCIIGGGPAGASMAAYLARAGVKCVVLERELFPRPHVGESLVPSSTRVFQDLGFLPKMEEAKFPHKYGAVWTSATSKSIDYHDFEGVEAVEGLGGCDIQFQEREQPGVDKPYTYHVDRGKFDLLLLQHAFELGATVCEGVRVAGVDFEAPDPVVKFFMGRKEMSLTAKIVVDASGRQTLIGNQLGLKVRDPMFDQFAIHTWFGGFDREATTRKRPGFGDYIFIHFMPVQNTWIWQIPITDDITSVGVVTQKKNFAKSKVEREKFFADTVATRPELFDAMMKAQQVRPFKEEGDYSYAMKQIVGDRFLLLGDAGRFVDPIFSTGVSIALNSARFAHVDVIAALEKGDYSRAAFSRFENTIRLGTKNWYDFISVYYRLNILFSHFVNSPAHRLDVIKLLQGDVYDEEQPEVLRKMREAVTEAEKNPKHIWHKMLNDLTSNAFSPTF
jgi:flavin-dependent dehydrogenase